MPDRHFASTSVPLRSRVRGLHAALARMSPIGLDELARIAVENRVDTKFIMSPEQAVQALDALSGDYRVLAIDAGRTSQYRTLYFDTPELTLYSRHHAGARNRFKVRKRAYLNTGVAFFELKSRSGTDRTMKLRHPIDSVKPGLDEDELDVLDENVRIDTSALAPVLDIGFERVSLLSDSHMERLTIDFGIAFRRGEEQLHLDGVAVAELKQEALDRETPFYRQMRSMNLRPMPFSKYCIGLAGLCEGLKHNRFGPTIKAVARISRGAHAGH